MDALAGEATQDGTRIVMEPKVFKWPRRRGYPRPLTLEEWAQLQVNKARLAPCHPFIDRLKRMFFSNNEDNQ
jgi:hypothetical protein